MASLDTTVLVDLLRRPSSSGRLAAVRLIERLQEAKEPLLTTRFCIAELLVGIEYLPNGLDARRKMDEALSDIGVLEFGDFAAERYAKIAAHLQKQGNRIGEMDLLIAATAQIYDQTVYTCNTSHFRRVPGLRVEEY